MKINYVGSMVNPSKCMNRPNTMSSSCFEYNLNVTVLRHTVLCCIISLITYKYSVEFEEEQYAAEIENERLLIQGEISS